jgi:hypothetical protein
VLEELSDHIMDIAMNSVRAGARHVSVSVLSDVARVRLTIAISDDGVGMAEDTLTYVVDPFYSTKVGKRVGLGIPLLKGAAEMCDGEFHIRSTPGEGTEIEATFVLDHPDLPPLGDVKETMFLLSVTNPEIRFSFRCEVDGKEFLLDTGEVSDVLGGVPLNHPEVVAYLRRYIEEHR